jgi:hypothetical protein
MSGIWTHNFSGDRILIGNNTESAIFAYFYDFRLDIRTDPTFWYFLFFILILNLM